MSTTGLNGVVTDLVFTVQYGVDPSELVVYEQPCQASALILVSSFGFRMF